MEKIQKIRYLNYVRKRIDFFFLVYSLSKSNLVSSERLFLHTKQSTKYPSIAQYFHNTSLFPCFPVRKRSDFTQKKIYVTTGYAPKVVKIKLTRISNLPEFIFASHAKTPLWRDHLLQRIKAESLMFYTVYQTPRIYPSFLVLFLPWFGFHFLPLCVLGYRKINETHTELRAF